MENTLINWDDAFDNSGYVPESVSLVDLWATEAACMRAQLTAQGRAQLDLGYGSHAREIYDYLLPDSSPQGTLIFIHGGYWHRLDKTYWSHFAKGCLSHDWAVAIPSYPLAPEARIAEITLAIKRLVIRVAESTDGPIVLAGHSAGGHLVARMACQGVLPDEVAGRIRRVVSISGVFHLNPLLTIQMNEVLQLTESEAMTESPVHLEPCGAFPVTFWVGAQERPEFLRQTRMITECWVAKSADIQDVYESGLHHFNVIQSLQDQQGSLTKAIVKK